MGLNKDRDFPQSDSGLIDLELSYIANSRIYLRLGSSTRPSIIEYRD